MTAYVFVSAVFSAVAATWATDPARRRAVARRTAQRREEVRANGDPRHPNRRMTH